MSTTTIRLSRQLHERLARRAEAENTTLAGAIDHALDVAEREEFWLRASSTMGSAEGHTAVRADAANLGGSLQDGLDPNETWDDVW